MSVLDMLKNYEILELEVILITGRRDHQSILKLQGTLDVVNRVIFEIRIGNRD